MREVRSCPCPRRCRCRTRFGDGIESLWTKGLSPAALAEPRSQLNAYGSQTGKRYYLTAATSGGQYKYSVDSAVKAWTAGDPAYGVLGGFPANKLTSLTDWEPPHPTAAVTAVVLAP
jgi:hypothetical protein